MSEDCYGQDNERVWPHWSCPECDAPNAGAEQCDPRHGPIQCDECGSGMEYDDPNGASFQWEAEFYRQRCVRLERNLQAAQDELSRMRKKVAKAKRKVAGVSQTLLDERHLVSVLRDRIASVQEPPQ